MADGPAPMATYAPTGAPLVSGQGAVLRDANGDEYLDFLAGIAVSALGYRHPQLTAALQDQIDKVVHVSNLFHHQYTQDVAARLCRLTDMGAVFFANSGAEANECALKLARKAMHDRGTPERSSFLALEGAFHGRTCGALSLTHTAAYREPFGPLLDAHWTPTDDVDALAAALRQRRFAALVLEPIQGEAGIRELSGTFLQAARELCDETGTLLVHDEIQSGCGRTGRFLCGQHHGVVPDVVTLAKPIAAGLPMGACLCSDALRDTLQKGHHGSTFGGGPLACRAASVFLDAIDDGLLDQVAARGAQLRAGLERIVAELPVAIEVRGRGLMLGLRLDRPAAGAQQALQTNGLLVNCTGTDVLRLVPPFVISEAEVARGLSILHETLTTWSANPGANR